MLVSGLDWEIPLSLLLLFSASKIVKPPSPEERGFQSCGSWLDALGSSCVIRYLVLRRIRPRSWAMVEMKEAKMRRMI